MPTEKKDDRSLRVFVVLSRAYKTLMDYVRQDVKQYGLNLTEFAVLELLYHKGSQTIQQIGNRILLASGSITYVVDQLSKKGLLKRRPCEEDRRVIHVELTEKGKEMFGQIFPKHQHAIHRALHDLSSEEKEILILLLKKLGIGVKKLNS